MSKQSSHISEHQDLHHPLIRLVSTQWFQRSSLILILGACVLIGVETNRAYYAQNYWWLHILDLTVLSLFAIELVLRYLADVLLSKSEGSISYVRFFKDGWHILDVIIVAICLLPHSEFFAVLRSLRILRVFLLIDEIPRLKILVNALIKSIPSMAYVMLLLCLHFYAYGVIGTDLFGVYSPNSFGSLGTSLLTLFQVVTGDGWSDVMRSVERNASHIPLVGIALYFVSFIVIGAMIFLNLFIGVITNEIAELKAEDDRRKYLLSCENEGKTIEQYTHSIEDKIKELQNLVVELRSVAKISDKR